MRAITSLAVLIVLVLSAQSSAEQQAASTEDDAYQVADNLLAAGRFVEAAEAYGVFHERFGRSRRAPEAAFRRGESLFRAGLVSDSLADRKEFLARAMTQLAELRKEPRALFRTGNILYLLGQPEEAAGKLKEFLARRGVPRTLEGAGRYFLARSLMALDKDEEARGVLAEASKSLVGPSAAYTLLALGDLEASEYKSKRDAAKFDAALSAYRGALEKTGKGRLVPETLFRIGELLRWAGKYDEAKRHYDRAVTQYSDSPVAPYAKLGSAWAALGNGDPNTARADATAARAASGDSWLADEAIFLEGSALIMLKDYAAASDVLSVFLERDRPLWAGRALRRLAWSALVSGKHEVAGKAAGRLMAVQGLSTEHATEARFIAAEAALAAGAPHEAAKLFTSAANGTGATAILASYRKASALSASGDAISAARFFDEFVQSHANHPLSTSAKALAARSYLAAGEGDLALARFTEARSGAQGSPDDHELLWGAALAQYMRGEFASMAELSREIIAKYGKEKRAADAAYWLAWTHLARSDWPKAADLFKDAAARAGADRPALAAVSLLEAASALERGGSHDAAVGTAVELLSGGLADQAPSELALWTAQALREKGRADEARKILDRVLSRTSTGADKARLLYALGEIARESKQYDEALSHYDQALSLEPGADLSAAARIGRGRCLAAKDRFEEAEVILENVAAMSAGWGHASAYVELGWLRLDWAARSEGERRIALATKAAEDCMLVALLYEPEGPGEGARLCVRALLGASRAYVFLGKHKTAINRIEQLLSHPFYGALPEAKEARKLLQQIRLPGVQEEAKP